MSNHNIADLSGIVKEKHKLIEAAFDTYKMIVWASGDGSLVFKDLYYGDEGILAGYYFEYLSLGLWNWRQKNRQILYKYLINDKDFLLNLLDFPKRKLSEMQVKRSSRALSEICNEESSDFKVYLFLIELSIITEYNLRLFLKCVDNYPTEFIGDHHSKFYLINLKIQCFYGHDYRGEIFKFGNCKLKKIEYEFQENLNTSDEFMPWTRELHLSDYIKNKADKEMFLFFVRYWASGGKIINFLFSKNIFNLYFPETLFLNLYNAINNLELEGPGLSLWWKFSKTLEFVVSTIIFKVFVNWHNIFSKVYEKPGRTILRRLCDYVYKKLSKTLDGENFDGLLPLSEAWTWF
jgi:hypothetical protein